MRTVLQVLDPSHVPFAHHGYQGNRFDVSLVSMSMASPLSSRHAKKLLPLPGVGVRKAVCCCVHPIRHTGECHSGRRCEKETANRKRQTFQKISSDGTGQSPDGKRLVSGQYVFDQLRMDMTQPRLPLRHFLLRPGQKDAHDPSQGDRHQRLQRGQRRTGGYTEGEEIPPVPVHPGVHRPFSHQVTPPRAWEVTNPLNESCATNC